MLPPTNCHSPSTSRSIPAASPSMHPATSTGFPETFLIVNAAYVTSNGSKLPTSESTVTCTSDAPRRRRATSASPVEDEPQAASDATSARPALSEASVARADERCDMMSSGWGGSGLREETRAPGAASRRLSAAPAPGYATRMAPLSRVRGVLETCLYASDLAAAERFYADVIGLEPFQRAAGRHVFFRCGAGVFLVFDPGRTSPDPRARRRRPGPRRLRGPRVGHRGVARPPDERRRRHRVRGPLAEGRPLALRARPGVEQRGDSGGGNLEIG